MAFCTKCGKPLRVGATFCTVCGGTARPGAQPAARPVQPARRPGIAVTTGSTGRALRIGAAGLGLILIALFFGYRPSIPFPRLSWPGGGAPAQKEERVDTSTVGQRYDAFAQMKEKVAQEDAEVDRRVEEALARSRGYSDAPQ